MAEQAGHPESSAAYVALMAAEATADLTSLFCIAEREGVPEAAGRQHRVRGWKGRGSSLSCKDAANDASSPYAGLKKRRRRCLARLDSDTGRMSVWASRHLRRLWRALT